MTALPSIVMPTLGKLIPRLASNHDGEVVATVAAIGRVLAANKLDFHDLAAALNTAASKDDEDWHDTLAYCALHVERLSQRDREFIRQIARWRGLPTEKQLAWLDDIAAKLRGRP
jgi:hypothetical protein